MNQKISINATNISKTYSHKFLFQNNNPVKALKNVSLSAFYGEIVSIIGNNGAGKTTFIKILSGIMRPDDGKVTVIESNPFERTKEYRKSVSIIMGQKSQMNEDVSIYDNAIFMASIYRIQNEIAEKRINALSKELGIENQLKQQVRTLSLGQRMKGDLLIAFLHYPKIIFLDEPTLGLDYSTQKAVRSFLKKYVSQNEATIILTSHNIDDIKELSDRIVILNGGKTLFTGTINNLYSIVKPKKYLEIRYSDDRFETVEIKLNEDFKEKLNQLIGDGYKEVNVIESNLNEIIEELYKRDI